ncbi:MAG TPA: methylated-DNA--[protein]-cysteine S-methyltransferase [Mollicutes bacterium]|nr:methylated-DNA--[protein]-cysteine S-methyltransferase [Mollicutes bacterium]
MYNKYIKIKSFIFEIIANDKYILEINRVNKIKEENSNQICKIASEEILKYFNKEISNINIEYLLQGTDFQKMVWNALLNIPYGKTLTYKEIAILINKPKAVRAVANAISKNKLLIIIPCHRVIGSNGSLTGFRGGLDLKEHLINLEKS